MDSFEINKIVACVLVVALVFIGLANFSEILYHVEKPEVAAYQVEGAEDMVVSASAAMADDTLLRNLKYQFRLCLHQQI